MHKMPKTLAKGAFLTISLPSITGMMISERTKVGLAFIL